jgi:hypothetical protein
MKTLTELAKRVSDEGYAPVLLHPEVWRLCELVAAEEREACAKVCDEMEEKAEGTECCKWPTPADCAYAIRARGQG